jgi:uncharacterized protein
MIESIAESNALPLIGLCLSFLIAIFLVRRRFNFGLSLIIGSLILGFFSLNHINIIQIPQAFIQAIIFNYNSNQITLETIELATLMTLIFLLAKTMQETGAINDLINNLKTIFKKGETMALIPAIYGLMPVPGGALFSAPLIDKEGDLFSLSKNQKNFLNVWFRHIWFPIYPISSAMILICDKDFTGLANNIPLYELIIANIPSFLVFIFVGSVFLYFFKKNTQITEKKTKKEYKKLTFLLIPTTPIILYILIFIIAIPFQEFSIYDYQRSIFIIGLIGSFFILYFLLSLSIKKYLNIIKKSLSFNIAFAIIGIMIFREMFNTTGVNYMLADLIKSTSIAPIFIIILIPFILGIVTGYNLGAIALSYVVIQPLFSTTQISIVGLTSIVFISSLAGYLISPIHLCNVVSSEHFKTDTTRMYHMYIPSVFVLLICQTLFILITY